MAALRDTVLVAETAERCGLHRIWITEHHAAPDNVCSQPALVIGHIAARTSTIRVGSGGVMLPNHAPLTVAEQFHTLTSMHPGRIDLGLGRAGGSNELTLQALGRRHGADTVDGFVADLDELTAFLTGKWIGAHPYSKIVPSPCGPPPPMYLLGSSPASAELAGRRGMPFVFAGQLAPTAMQASASRYHESFDGGAHPHEPYLIIATGVVCGRDTAAARASARLAGLVRMRAAKARGSGRSPSAAELLDPCHTPAEAASIDQTLEDSGYVVGDAGYVLEQLGSMAERHGASEIMLVSPQYGVTDRLETLTELAGERSAPSAHHRVAAG